MIENQETITLGEFKAWLIGLIRGKNNTLPDLEDWKIIKTMLDKVVSEKEVVVEKEYIPCTPPPQYWRDPIWSDNTDNKFTTTPNVYIIGRTTFGV